MKTAQSRRNQSGLWSLTTGVVCLAMGTLLTGCSEPGGDASKSPAADPNQAQVLTENEPEFADWPAERREKVSTAAQDFCGNCHAMPKPSSFSARHWGREVQRGFDFYFASGRADLMVPKSSDIKQFFVSLAPTELQLPKFMPLDRAAEQRFHIAQLKTLATSQAVAIASVSQWDLGSTLGECLVFSDMRGGTVQALKLADIPNGLPVQLAQLRNPSRVQVCRLEDGSEPGLLVADLGSFLPADHQAGRVVWLRPTGREMDPYEVEVLHSGCGRVCDVQAQDLDKDGDLDVVVADFGWHETGRLLWLERVASGPARADAFVMHVLDKRPGALESQVMDINNDGHQDIVALLAQEHEAVMAYLSDGQGNYQAQVLFAADDPAYGSSGMVWQDMDRDGDMDCILTNGDSFDSFEVKPYHSIHWLENVGALKFVDHEIVRLPGVHEAVACDLDNDHDLDIVAAAFLPRDLRSALRDEPVGLIWLENDGRQNFHARPLQLGQCLHPALWAGDLNGDGQVDLALANFYEDTAQLRPALDFFMQRSQSP